MRYSYRISSINESDRWVFISSNDDDINDTDSFVFLVKTIASQAGAKVKEVGNFQYLRSQNLGWKEGYLEIPRCFLVATWNTIFSRSTYSGVTLFGIWIWPPSQNKATLSPVLRNASRRQMGLFSNALSVSSDKPKAMQAPTKASRSREYVVPTAKSRWKPTGGVST